MSLRLKSIPPPDKKRRLKKKPMITKEQIVEYEVGSLSLLQTAFCKGWLFKLFMRKVERKWKRYQEYREMYDKTGEYLNKYFTK
jgi:hypothetical protein